MTTVTRLETNNNNNNNNTNNNNNNNNSSSSRSNNNSSSRGNPGMSRKKIQARYDSAAAPTATVASIGGCSDVTCRDKYCKSGVGGVEVGGGGGGNVIYHTREPCWKHACPCGGAVSGGELPRLPRNIVDVYVPTCSGYHGDRHHHNHHRHRDDDHEDDDDDDLDDVAPTSGSYVSTIECLNQVRNFLILFGSKPLWFKTTLVQNIILKI